MDNKNIELAVCCTCGHSWQKGRDGSHSCTAALLKRIDDLDKKLDQAIDLLDFNGRAFLLAEWAEANSPQRP